jgi:hypothetical protein
MIIRDEIPWKVLPDGSLITTTPVEDAKEIVRLRRALMEAAKHVERGFDDRLNPVDFSNGLAVIYDALIEVGG